LGEAAISGSKFVFLRADGDWDIWNQEDGHWKDDLWYSNRSYVKSAFGFSQWPKAKDLPVRDEPTHDDPDVDESQYYHWLTNDEQAIYADMLKDGFTCDEIDSEIAQYGSLRHMSRWTSYDEEAT
jgi:hypothetical protein